VGGGNQSTKYARNGFGHCNVRSLSAGEPRVHYREDFPKKEPVWLVNVNARKENGEIKLFKSPVVINKTYPMDPPKNEA
jgi:succinate dehydrogenase/fumarate reductase flavoprotein subunit